MDTDNSPVGYACLMNEGKPGNSEWFKKCMFDDIKRYSNMICDNDLILRTPLDEHWRFPLMKSSGGGSQVSYKVGFESRNPVYQNANHESDDDPILYEADIVPAIQVKVNGKTQYYVPKQPKHSATTSYKDNNELWRRSYPKEEQEIMSHLDDDGGCRKQCIRTLKAIRDLLQLTATCSYHIKTLVMNMARDISSSEYWVQENFGVCVIECLEKLCDCLCRSDLRNYFDQPMNLLSNPDGMIDLRDQLDQQFDSFHLKCFLNNEKFMVKLLTYRGTSPFDIVQRGKNEITRQFWTDVNFGINGPPPPGYNAFREVKNVIGRHNYHSEYQKMRECIMKLLKESFDIDV